MADVFEKKHFKVNGRKVYVAVQSSPARRERNRMIAQGLEGCIQYISGVHVDADWAGASLFAGPASREIRIGDLRLGVWPHLGLMKQNFSKSEFEAALASAASGN